MMTAVSPIPTPTIVCPPTINRAEIPPNFCSRVDFTSQPSVFNFCNIFKKSCSFSSLTRVFLPTKLEFVIAFQLKMFSNVPSKTGIEIVNMEGCTALTQTNTFKNHEVNVFLLPATGALINNECIC